MACAAKDRAMKFDHGTITNQRTVRIAPNEPGPMKEHRKNLVLEEYLRSLPPGHPVALIFEAVSALDGPTRVEVLKALRAFHCAECGSQWDAEFAHLDCSCWQRQGPRASGPTMGGNVIPGRGGLP